MKRLEFILIRVLALTMVWAAIAQEASHARDTTSGSLSDFLKVASDIPLPGSPTRIDYQSVDEARSLLFIAHLGDNSVTVFDLKASVVVKNLTNIPKPHGILAVPTLGKVFVSATGSDQIYVLDEEALTIVDKIPGGHYPDGLDYDPNTKRIFVSDEFGKTVTVINTSDNRVLATIQMGGEVGNTHFDPTSKLIYSAVQTTDEFVAIDPASMKIRSRYNLPGCKGPHGFLIDRDSHYAFITGEGNASYVVFDLDARKIIDHGTVGDEPDVLAFDKENHILYVSAESGDVAIFKMTQGAIAKLYQGFLAPHAHTVAVDPRTHNVYFPLQDIDGKPVLRIMERVTSRRPK